MSFIITKTASRHSCDSPDWYTPPEYSQAAREVMGDIDLDPASDAIANKMVQAKHFYTEQDNGLTKLWAGRVFLNPPGGQVNAFWGYLLKQYLKGHVSEFVWVGYSLEQLQTLQQLKPFRTPLSFSLCFPAKRIAFIENDMRKNMRVHKLLMQGKKPNLKSSPSHANYIAYGGPNRTTFQNVFSKFGECIYQ